VLSGSWGKNIHPHGILSTFMSQLRGCVEIENLVLFSLGVSVFSWKAGHPWKKRVTLNKKAGKPFCNMFLHSDLHHLRP